MSLAGRRAAVPPRRVCPQSASFDSVAHIEGLVGEEDSLLRIPAEERTHEQHQRLRALEQDLDKVCTSCATAPSGSVAITTDQPFFGRIALIVSVHS